MIQVYPALLEQDIHELQRKIDIVKDLCSIVHLDIMDGEFVPNTTCSDPRQIAKLDWGNLQVALHLMITRPSLYLKKWAFPQVVSMTVHQEASENLSEIIRMVHDLQKKVGVAINPHTPTYDIKSVLNEIDSVMVMGVEPGFAAQAFNADILQKIRYLRELNAKIEIVVDGGVNNTTINMIKEAGATSVCANSYLFKSENIPEAIKSLQ